MSLFDFPPDRLTELSDGDLRELVARLCECERERHGGHRTEVRWGGAHTAPDGGLDVTIEVNTAFEPSPTIPRSRTGIQVKAGGLGPSAIREEMRPDGELRASISQLADRHGAYLIVSVGENCSKVMLARRQTAMREAVEGHPHSASLYVDFIDRHQLARWVSSHPAASLWAREQLALPNLRGWRPFGRWSATPSGVNDELISEPGLTFQIPKRGPLRDVGEALAAIRGLVRDRAKAIRIAGLSGIGKSRLVQALFESTGEDEPLSRSLAVYADAGQDPDPAPIEMLEVLISSHQFLVLIVDNCPPKTHQVLARALASSGGNVRLVTVEYDVRDDRPEETEVIRIEADGPEIVQALLRRRHPELSSTDAYRLAELSQGNARLALALAAAAPDTGTLSSFDDAGLFDRLFWQRSERDAEMANASEALSLVYSFDVDGIEDPDELQFLSELTGVPRRSLYRHALTLLDRGLAQARGRWRAILPQALANRVARQCIRSIPWRDIADAFGQPDARRLRHSFGRRLSYLHDLDFAKLIVLRWMKTDGPLNSSQNSASFDFDLLERVCHLAPRAAFDQLPPLIASAINDQCSADRLDAVTRLISRLAHSEEHFTEACQLLINLALAAEQNAGAKADRAIEGLFGLYFSGTLARTEARIDIARNCLGASDSGVTRRGILMLSAALKTELWDPPLIYFDDARPDACGWYPDGLEVVGWYSAWIEVALSVSLNAAPSVQSQARETFAQNLAELWRDLPSLREVIENAAGQLNQREPWVEGWNALRRMQKIELRRDGDCEHLEPDRLAALIHALEPVDLLERVRAVLRSSNLDDYELEEDTAPEINPANKRVVTHPETLGRELALQSDILDRVGRELYESRSNSLYDIGLGLGAATEEPSEIWMKLRDWHLMAPEKTTSYGILRGFIHALDERDLNLVEQIRFECLSNPTLRRTYAVFAAHGTVNASELNRLLQAASDPEAPAHQFGSFVWRQSYGLTDAHRVSLLEAMMAGLHGAEAILDALGMLRHVEQESPREWPVELRRIGLNAVTAVVTGAADRLDNMLDHRASTAVEKCLLPDEKASARSIIDAIAYHAQRRYGSLYDVQETVGVLAQRAPEVFLDRTLGAARRSQRGLRIDRYSSFRRAPLSCIEPGVLVEWCRAGSSERWTTAAEAVFPFGTGRNAGEDATSDTLSDQARALIAASPDPDPVIAAFASQLTPRSWSGSRAQVMATRLSALEELLAHPESHVRNAAQRHLAGARRNIEIIGAHERQRERERDLSFE